MENPNSGSEFSPADREAAQQLVEQDEVLKDDAVARNIAETGVGVGDVPLSDVGDALADRKAFLEKQNDGVRADMDEVRAQAMDAHSKPQDNN